MNTKSIKFTPANFLSFGLGMSGVFLMFLFQALNFHPTSIISSFIEPHKVTAQKEAASEVNKLRGSFESKKIKIVIPRAYASQN